MNNSFVFVFPGQGSQKVGMGKELYDENPTIKKLFDEAAKTLDFDVLKIMFEGPLEELTQTNISQPAIYLLTAGLSALLKNDKGIIPAAAAGHSLGEYAALFAAGSYDFMTGLKIVAERGRLMHELGNARPGTMAAVLGMTNEKVEALCKSIDGYVIPANYNIKDMQVVVSGEYPAVEALCEKAQAEGARKAMLLPVSGAFHSELQEPVSEQFEAFLHTIDIAAPTIEFVSNVTAQPVTTADEIKTLMVQQLTSPVLWDQILRRFLDNGHMRYIEPCAKPVIKGMMRGINKDALVLSAMNTTTIDAIVETCNNNA